jgi:RNA polymerase sigma-70 factor (ECF subfamily)
LEFFAFDEGYLERLRSGEFRTVEHFASYFSQLIQLKLRARVRSPEAIEDIRQETFARVFATLRSADGLRQADRLGPYVNSVCNYVLLEYYRSSTRDTPLPEGPEGEDAPEIPDTRVDILGEVMTRQTSDKIRNILDGLSERDRRLLKEVFLDERNKDDVCRDFGVDRNYLRVLLHRAKQIFKSQYIKNMEAEQRRVG